jgi:hypothetical protein
MLLASTRIKMKNFVKVIKEINRTLNFLFLFETLINSAIFFLIVYLLLAVINLYPILAFIPALIYFLMRLFINLGKDKRLIVESKYSPLREKLRTAADNIKEDNPVIEELEEEVVNDLKQVGMSSFLHTKQVSYKIFAAIFLSFAIVFITQQNLYIVDLNKLFSDIPGAIQTLNPAARVSNVPIGDINESDDIYGDSKLAVLGEKQIDIKIKPANYEISVREGGDAEQKQFDEIFPNEVVVEQASAFEENIPEEQQELVKNYFDNIAGG